MYGLILKDVLANKKYLYMAGAVVVFYIIYGFVVNDKNFFVPMLVLFCGMFILSTFSYDDMAQWNMYALTLPTGRNQIVYAKYLLSFLFTLLAGIISIIINLLHQVLNIYSFSKDDLLLIWICCIGSLVFNSIQIPIVIKMGSEKARFAIIAVLFIPTLLIGSLSRLELLAPIKKVLIQLVEYKDLLLLISPLLLLLVVMISINISIHLFKKKEF